MEFYSESNRPKTIPQPETSQYEDEYEEVINKDGKVELKKTGTINVYEKIQAASEGITLRELISKYQIKVDDWDLTKINDSINDLTEIPENIIEYMNIVNKAKEIFESAPEQVRKVFNNNFNEFLIGSQNGSLKSALKKYQPEAQKIEEQSNIQPIEEKDVEEQNLTPNGGINL